MFDFDFAESFKRNSELQIAKIVPELQLMQRRADEYDAETVSMHAFQTSLSISLQVSKSVFEEYHQALQTALESRSKD